MNQEKTLHICLVRHGETEENLARILQGHLPGTLTETGKYQALTLREELDMTKFDVIVSSDLKRVTDTVEILLNGKEISWEKSASLREIDWGSMTGMKIEEVNFKQLAEDVETREMLYERAKQVAEKLQKDHLGKTILVVSHGLFLRSLIANLTHVPFSELHTIQHMKNCEARWLEIKPITQAFSAESNALYEKLSHLPITDLAPVYNNGVRGRTLSASSNNWLLPKIKEAGITTIIDLRTADHTDRFDHKVTSTGLEYKHIAIDSKNTDSREIIDSLPSFFEWLDKGNFYIACAMGLHRTDIALSIYYTFHPSIPLENVPELRGHRKDGKLRCDDIARRLNSIMQSLTLEDLHKMDLPEDYEKEFIRRKKKLFEINSIF